MYGIFIYLQPTFTIQFKRNVGEHSIHSEHIYGYTTLQEMAY